MLESKQLNDIGFDYIIENLEPWSPFGEELRRRVRPYTGAERAELAAEFGNIALLADAYRSDPAAFGPAARYLMQFKDIRRSLARSRETTLSDIELFEIKRFLILLEGFAPAFSALGCAAELRGIDIRTETAALDILDPDGMRAQTFRLGDNCSELLRSIRRQRKDTDIALRTLESGNGAEKDRLTAERTRLAALEENEELRIRGEMTRAFSEYSAEIAELIANIARFDFALAKARLMLALGGTVPEILPEDGEKRIEFVGMVNPAIRASLALKGRAFTPVSIELEPGSTVITGANMGGKSVAVKTCALNAYLAVCGMPVFCAGGKLPLVPDIHLLCEDLEDSRGGLSSFGGEMVRFGSIIEEAKAKPGSLVLLDEFARGTNPHEGSALVRAAVRYFNGAESGGAYALITTHFDGIARYAKVHYQVMGLRNADTEELMNALSREKAEAAGGGKAVSPQELLSRYMDYGLYRVGTDANPPRDALKICRALRIPDGFMNCVQE